MTQVVVSTKEAVLQYLDSINNGVLLPVLHAALIDHDIEDIKAATRELYEERAINRLSVKASKGHLFVFYSLYIRTINVPRPDRPLTELAQVVADMATPAPVVPAPEVDLSPLFEPVPAPLPAGPLTPDEAVDVLTRGGWVPEPEIVTVERRVADRRAPRIGIMDVIDRWKLGYRLSRIIEIVGCARRRQLTEDDAEMVVRLIREHVKPADDTDAE